MGGVKLDRSWIAESEDARAEQRDVVEMDDIVSAALQKLLDGMLLQKREPGLVAEQWRQGSERAVQRMHRHIRVTAGSRTWGTSREVMRNPGSGLRPHGGPGRQARAPGAARRSHRLRS